MKKLLLIFAITTILFVAGCGPGKYDAFAECVTASGAVMYGAYWCPHCAEQKEAFGSSFSKVTYIECSLPGGQGQTAVCEQAGITSYPTWEFADGERETGQLSIEQLAARTGCAIE